MLGKFKRKVLKQGQGQEHRTVDSTFEDLRNQYTPFVASVKLMEKSLAGWISQARGLKKIEAVFSPMD